MTRFAILPYGGAFVALEGLQHLVAPVVHVLTGLDVHLVNLATLLVLGSVTAGLINSAPLRGRFFRSMAWAGRIIRIALIDIPARLIQLPLLRAMLGSRPVRLIWQALIKPLLAAMPLASSPFSPAGLHSSCRR